MIIFMIISPWPLGLGGCQPGSQPLCQTQATYTQLVIVAQKGFSGHTKLYFHTFFTFFTFLKITFSMTFILQCTLIYEFNVISCVNHVSYCWMKTSYLHYTIFLDTFDWFKSNGRFRLDLATLPKPSCGLLLSYVAHYSKTKYW